MTIPTLLLFLAWGFLPRTPGDTSLSGIVVDERGAPVAGALVRIEISETAPRRARTGAQGRFEIGGLASGRLYRLIATAEGYAPLLASGALEKSPARVPPPLRLVLPRGRTATGRVVDEAGRPIAGARVALSHSLSARDLASWLGLDPLDNDLYVVHSGEDGRFVTLPLTFPRAEIVVWAEGFLSLNEDRALPAGPGEADFGALVLRRGTTVAGRVSDPDGRPIAGAEIWPGIGRSRPSDPAPLLARSAGDGAFTLAAEPAEPENGEILVCHDGFLGEKVALPGGLPGALPDALPDALPEKTAAPLAVVLHPVGRIRGRVLAPDGSPLPGAYVAYSNPVESATDDFIPTGDPCDPAQATGGETDALGRFTLSPPSFTWYEIEARAQGYVPTPLGRRLHVEEGGTIEGIEIRMVAGATIVGRVLTPAGEPVAGAEVYGWSQSTETARTVAGPDGAYRLAGIVPGPQKVTAAIGEKVEASSTERQIDVAPGENRLDLTLARAVTHEVRGRVLGPEGEPIPGARLVQGTDEHLSGPDGIAAGDGTFSLRLRDGSYTLAAEAEGFASRSIPVTVAGADLDGLEIRLLHGCALAVHIRGLAPGDSPLITVTPPAGSSLRPFLVGYADREEGGYRIADLSPGEWTLVAESPPRQITAKVTLGPGEPCVDGELDLAFPEEFAVQGRVVDPAGQPLAGASLSLEVADGRSIAQTTSGEEGGFSLSVEGGTYTLRATADGAFLPQPLLIQVADVAVDGVEVVLRQGASIHGRVLGLAPGDPVQISASSAGSSLTQWTEDDHTYRLDGLAPGEWTVTAFLYDGPFQRSHVSRRITVPPDLDAPAERTLDLVMPPAGGDPQR